MGPPRRLRRPARGDRRVRDLAAPHARRRDPRRERRRSGCRGHPRPPPRHDRSGSSPTRSSTPRRSAAATSAGSANASPRAAGPATRRPRPRRRRGPGGHDPRGLRTRRAGRRAHRPARHRRPAQRGERPRRGGRGRGPRSVAVRDHRRVSARSAGVGRRLERKGEAAGVVVYDDYGHHPTAIVATLAAIRQREPGRRVWAVYEPLTFHRTAAMLGSLRRRAGPGGRGGRRRHLGRPRHRH